jgi:choline dehydrogenase
MSSPTYLHVETSALAEALELEGNRCVGVRYSVGNDKSKARASREVVVSGGSINSPQLLELSRIGQPERLCDLGIEVRHALPGVGENLRDHYAPRTRWAIGAKGITFNDKGRGLGLVGQALRYAFFQDGMLGSAAAHSIERMIILSLTAQSRQTSQCIFRLQQRLSSDGSLFR